MKKNLNILFALVAIFTMTTSVIAQQSAELPKAYMEKLVPGAQLGMVMCEDANGTMLACTGNMEETILGIVTSIPYVTINKPTSPDGSKYIFESYVSADNGAVNKGDYLIAGASGNFVKAESESTAYAIALEEVQGGQKMIRVKLLSK